MLKSIKIIKKINCFLIRIYDSVTQRDNKLICCPNWDDEKSSKNVNTRIFLFLRNNRLCEIMLHVALGCEEEILKVNFVLIIVGQISHEIHVFLLSRKEKIEWKYHSLFKSKLMAEKRSKSSDFTLMYILLLRSNIGNKIDKLNFKLQILWLF